MSRQLRNLSLHHWLALGFIVLALILSQLRLMDDYSDRYTSKALAVAAVSYASARGINALVSVAQTSTVEGGLLVSGSVGIGQLLDPLNDLIERFSSVMTWVLASLALQKTLLLISSDSLFILLLWLLGGATILFMLQTRQVPARLFLRLFLVMLLLRFSVTLAVSLNSAVDGWFLQQQTMQYQQQVGEFKAELSFDDPVELVNESGFFQQLEARVEQVVGSLINLMVLFLLTSLLLPLLFFYLLVHGVRLLWRSDLFDISG